MTGTCFSVSLRVTTAAARRGAEQSQSTRAGQARGVRLQRLIWQIGGHDCGGFGAVQHQRPGSAIGTDQTLPGLASDSTAAVRGTCP
jgi:hypothetical protein